MSLDRIRELAGLAKTINEVAPEYADSSDFTDEFYGMMHDLKKMVDIIKSKRFENWLKITDVIFNRHHDVFIIHKG